MQKFPFIIFTALFLAACAGTSHQEIVQENAASSAEQQAVPMHQSGYILKLDGNTNWFLKQNDQGSLVELTFGGLTSCVREASGEPCAVSDFVEGMQLDIHGTGFPNDYEPTMAVTEARITGTSLTFMGGGMLSAKPDGVWRLSYEDEGITKKIRVILSKETICQDDGLTTPCGRWMEGRGGSVIGEIRQGEQAVRATWVDLP